MDQITINKLYELDSCSLIQFSNKIQNVVQFISRLNNKTINEFQAVVSTYHGAQRLTLDKMIAARRLQLPIVPTLKTSDISYKASPFKFIWVFFLILAMLLMVFGGLAYYVPRQNEGIYFTRDNYTNGNLTEVIKKVTKTSIPLDGNQFLLIVMGILLTIIIIVTACGCREDRIGEDAARMLEQQLKLKAN